MSSGLAFHAHEFEARAISPLREMGAYEALWATPGTSFKTLSEKFAATPGALPSEFVPPDQAENCAHTVLNRFREAVINRFGVRVHGAGEYPEKLRDAEHAYSGRSLPLIPPQSCHPFHGKPATDATPKLPPIPVKSATPSRGGRSDSDAG